MWRWSGIGFIVLAALLCSCGMGGGSNVTLTEEATAVPENKEKPVTQEQEETMGLKLTSSAFNEGDLIPKLYTCDGKDISPPLAWTGVPGSAKSLALICDDPDAPAGVWDHWVLFDLPVSATGLPEAVQKVETPPLGGRQGRNSWGKVGYGGPCPPSGTHRYIFKLYALDMELNLKAGVGKEDVEKAMEGHILAQTQLMGKYKRS